MESRGCPGPSLWPEDREIGFHLHSYLWWQGPRGERGPQGSSGEKGDQVSIVWDVVGGVSQSLACWPSGTDRQKDIACRLEAPLTCSSFHLSVQAED